MLGSTSLGVCALLPLGCQQQMASQPAYRPLEPSAFFPDGKSARDLVPGTVPRGYLRADVAMYTGKNPTPQPQAGTPKPVEEGRRVAANDVSYVTTFPFPVTREVLERGQQRYQIFCVVCHDPLGTGHGKIVERGYTPPPSYHIARLREAPVGHFFDVITNGYGSMPDYRAQIPPRDRWAIVAYIRALQLSQHATLQDVPPEDRAKLQGGRP
jgi:mono/diheme cytochrome c family protein